MSWPAALATMLLAAGCLEGRYECASSAACSRDGVQGTCEASGFCSFPDPSCAPTARRYGELADGAHKGRCVDDGAPGCIRDVGAGGAHSCLVRGDGTVWCWGANEAGQLGNGSFAGAAAPVAVIDDAGGAFGDAAQVDAGRDFTCARRLDGSAWCWGNARRLGDGGEGSVGQPVPRRVRKAVGVPLDGVVQLSAGESHACAVRIDGTVWCWGAGDAGQLGDGATDERRAAAQVRQVDGAAFDAASLVAAGASFTCAARPSNVWCWGANMFAQLGQPGGVAASSSPVIALPAAATALAAGGAHACAVEIDGSAWCWGRAEDGQIGEPGLPGVGVAPVRVQVGGAPLAGARTVAAGEAHSCATIADGGVRCWGAGDSGQLGDPARTGSETAVEVATTAGAPLGEALAVTAGIDDYHAAGGRHSCARQRDAVWCWGAGDSGQLGDGRMQSSAVATPVALSVALSGACP
jgi:alpha-tubulin suppressor-like RCC1 family protein